MAWNIVVMALLFSLAGAGMLYTAERVTRDAVCQDALRLPVIPMGVCCAAMLVVNVASAVLLHGFYQLSGPDIARTLLTLSLLWACAWADARAYLIPNKVLGQGGLGGVILLAVRLLAEPGYAVYHLVDRVGAMLLLFAVSGVCRLISPRAVGMGDVKILAVMGLCLGMNLVWSALFWSFGVLFVVCLGLLAAKKAKRSDSIPFAPALLAGTVLAVVLTGI